MPNRYLIYINKVKTVCGLVKTMGLIGVQKYEKKPIMRNFLIKMRGIALPTVPLCFPDIFSLSKKLPLDEAFI
ncbi:hypothetical protein HMPREF9151_02012 [Hoylesella saccharolytica F0055]|uniref:Uncharacterized protein n=1 Tax=Hoylesella saccharolytica F0055 TaxID=1127699 RepID=L1N4E8_9BACT|nr:hypothetical protein HMPREF9151_02012 [Hoylesella saccharolytica F0055]